MFSATQNYDSLCEAVTKHLVESFPTLAVFDGDITDSEEPVKDGSLIKPYIVVDYNTSPTVGKRHENMGNLLLEPFYFHVHISVTSPRKPLSRKLIAKIKDVLNGYSVLNQGRLREDNRIQRFYSQGTVQLRPNRQSASASFRGLMTPVPRT